LNCFATIITANYLPYALALNDSLIEFDTDVKLKILISDKVVAPHLDIPENVKVQFYTDLCDEGLGYDIKEKYHTEYHDAFRWSMKPVYMNYLLDTFEKVIYVDCDIQFFGPFQFLFEILDQSDIMLSPHFRSSNSIIDPTNFIIQFNSGIYNGGFIGANKKGIEALSWWGKTCLNICEVNPCKGQFVDQSHLNLLPVFFNNIHVLKHRGCNVANWNQVECVRTSTKTNEVLINNEWPIIFIHFTGSTIKGILRGDDVMLEPFLNIYDERLSRFGLGFSLKDKFLKNLSEPNKKEFSLQKLSKKIKWRIAKGFFPKLKDDIYESL
jgi:lipopolysaccharide biosynthesis glycosyltransferase